MEITFTLQLLCLVSLILIVHRVAPKISQNSNVSHSQTDPIEPSNRVHRIEPNEQNLYYLHSAKLVEPNGTAAHDRRPHIHLVGWQWTKMKNPWIFCTFLLIAVFAKLGYHYSSFLTNYIPESCILVIIGLAFGATIHVLEQTQEVPKFTVDLFFYALLPPIILESAYSLHDRDFFNNLGTILLYAVIGTFINISLIGTSLYLVEQINFTFFAFPSVPFIELMIFAAAISAVDPVSVLAIFKDLSVNKPLYFLVFGESLLNDAVVIVVHRLLWAMLDTDIVTGIDFALGFVAFLFVSVGGFIIGSFFGVITSVLTLKTTHVRVIEPMVVVAMAYIAFLSAEIVHWSGIISIIGCGLFQAEYALKNVSRKSYTTVKYFTQTLSTVSDLLIFFFLGTMLINETPDWSTSFALISLLFCVAYRFVSVFSLTFISNNLFKREPTISLEEQALMSYGGLRGAVAFALIAILSNERIKFFSLFRTTTLFIILFTVFIMGGTTKPLLNFLRIRKEEKSDAKLFHLLNEKLIEEVMVGIADITGTHTFHYYWMQKIAHINDKYIKKYLTHGRKSEKIESALQKLIFEDEMERIWGIEIRSQHGIKQNGTIVNTFDNNEESNEDITDDTRSTTAQSVSTINIDDPDRDRDAGDSHSKRSVVYRWQKQLSRLIGKLIPVWLKKSFAHKSESIKKVIRSTKSVDTSGEARELNQILETAFAETSISQNALRKSVSKGQLINRQLLKKRMSSIRQISVDARTASALRAKSAAGLTLGVDVDYQQNYIHRPSLIPLDKYGSPNRPKPLKPSDRESRGGGEARRVSLISNLDSIEDNANER